MCPQTLLKDALREVFGIFLLFTNPWALFDNSGKMPLLIACEEEGGATIFNQSIYNEIIKCGIKP
jgi:predicted ABC-type ATPase